MSSYHARIKLAVLDTGIHALHPYLQQNGWQARNEHKQHYYDATKGPLKLGVYHEPVDEVGHGTHIAGLILSLVPNIELYIIRVFEGAKINKLEQPRAVDAVANVRSKTVSLRSFLLRIL